LTFDTGLDYSLNTSIGGFFLSADYYFNDGFYWEPDNFLRQKSYGLLSARVKYQPTDHYGITLWGKNLTGEEYATTAVTQAGPAGYPYIPGPARTYGLTFDFKF
jgi:iron complex outermembrane receptor protein